jgi:energy-coupling factor transporter transmembrane protein EcfT
MSEYFYITSLWQKAQDNKKRAQRIFTITVICLLTLPIINAGAEWVFLSNAQYFFVYLFLLGLFYLSMMYYSMKIDYKQQKNFKKVQKIINALEVKNDRQELFEFFSYYIITNYHQQAFELLYERLVLQNFQKSKQLEDTKVLFEKIDLHFDLGEDDKLSDDVYTSTTIYSNLIEQMVKDY